MNPWVAADICKAIYDAAETGQGDVRKIYEDNPYRISIHTRRAVAYALIDPNTFTLNVGLIESKS